MLTATGAHGAELVRTPVARATRALLELDWDLFKDFMARVLLRLDREHVDAYCSGLDGEVDARLLLAWLDEIEDHDASDCLDAVEAAVLILEW